MSANILMKVEDAIVRLRGVAGPAKSFDITLDYVDKMFDEISRVKSFKWSWKEISDFICAGDEEMLKSFGKDKLRSMFARVSAAREQAKPVEKENVRKSRKPRETGAKEAREICETVVVAPRENSVTAESAPAKAVSGRIRTVVED